MDREQRAAFDEDYLAFVRAVIRARRCGIGSEENRSREGRRNKMDSRIVRAWISGRRAIMDRDALHNLPGDETDLPGEIDVADIWIALNAVPLIEEGRSLTEIRAALSELVDSAEWPDWLGNTRFPGEIDKMKAKVRKRLRTKQNLHERLAKLGIQTGKQGPSSEKA
jgi:hypothetical protein